MYNSQQDFQFGDFKTRVLVVDTNGGSLTVQKQVGEAWVISDVITADTAVPMIFGTGPVRFVPTAGCTYEVEQ